MKNFHAIAACSIVIGSQSLAQDSATIRYIVEPINNYATTSANDISPDGRWIVGGLDTDGDFLPDIGYRWDSVNDVFTIIEKESSPNGVTEIKAVSDDGQVLIGDLTGLPGSEVQQEAGIWTESIGWVGLGWLPNAGTCPSRSNTNDGEIDFFDISFFLTNTVDFNEDTVFDFFDISCFLQAFGDGCP